MNAEELKAWVQRTADRFPQVSQLFERAADRNDLAASWATVLESVPAEVANEYVDAMLAGNPEPPTFAADWARLPAMLRRWSYERKPLNLSPARFTPDERTYKCLACLDRGYGVEIFSPSWVKAHRTEIELGELPDDWQRAARRWCRERGYKLTGSVDCSCETGRRQAEKRRHKALTYQPGQHCLVPGGGQGAWMDALAKWVAEHPIEATNAWQPVQSYGDVIGD